MVMVHMAMVLAGTNWEAGFLSHDTKLGNDGYRTYPSHACLGCVRCRLLRRQLLCSRPPHIRRWLRAAWQSLTQAISHHVGTHSYACSTSWQLNCSPLAAWVRSLGQPGDFSGASAAETLPSGEALRSAHAPKNRCTSQASSSWVCVRRLLRSEVSVQPSQRLRLQQFHAIRKATAGSPLLRNIFLTLSVMKPIAARYTTVWPSD
jgi:hypothetical protein